MSVPPTPLRLPWDVIFQIIQALQIDPIDPSEERTLDLYRGDDPSTSFAVRCDQIQDNWENLLVWMRVSKDTKIVASKLLYSTIVLTELSSLVTLRKLVVASSSSSQPVGSLVRYLALGRVESDDDVSASEDGYDDNEFDLRWWAEMGRLIRLLPNLTSLRGPSGIQGSTKMANSVVLQELVSCAPRSLINLINLRVSSSSLATFVSLLERTCSTLRYLGVTILDPPLNAIIHDPATYPSLDFPSLTKLSFHSIKHRRREPLLLPLATSRWNLPNLRTLETNASPCLLPFLRAHGSTIRELGLKSQERFDKGTYERWLAMCPILDTLAWRVWEWEPEEDEPDEFTMPVVFNIRRPVLSVRTITIAQDTGDLDFSSSSCVNDVVPWNVNTTNFPSLRRVVFRNQADEVSETILAWGQSLVQQGVAFEWQ